MTDILPCLRINLPQGGGQKTGQAISRILWMMGSAVRSAALLCASRSRITAPDILDSLDATTPLPVRVRARLQVSIEDAFTIYL
jgi:hypothetical protein